MKNKQRRLQASLLILYVLTMIPFTSMSEVRKEVHDVSSNGRLATTSIICTDPISLAYAESFESGVGWSQVVTGDEMDWTGNSGETLSSSTGPDQASNGSFYLYLEASGNSNKTAILESECFDLNGLGSAFFSFQYHMYGSDMGSLTLQIATEDNPVWQDVWMLSGNQGNAWNRVDLRLDAYINKIVKLRMVGRTGDGFQSDLAIDDLLFWYPEDVPPTAPSDLVATAVTSNSVTLAWTASTDNAGLVKEYAVYQGTNKVGTVDSSGYVIAGLSSSTLYQFSVVAVDAAGNESVPSNVLQVSTQLCEGTFDVPQSESFELGDGWTQVTWDDGDWVRNTGGTTTSATGPDESADGSFYMYIETTPSENRASTFVLESKCYDLTGDTTAAFLFQYHMYGEDIGTLTVQVATEATPWTDVWEQSGDQGNMWQRVHLDLDDYSGKVIKLRIIGKTLDSGSRGDMAFDDLLLFSPDRQAPSVPTDLFATNVSLTSLTLNWTASSDNVGVTSYEIYEDTSSLGVFSSTNIELAGLAAGTLYSFEVVAKDAAGNVSDRSEALEVTTLSEGACISGTDVLPLAEGFEFSDGWRQVTWDAGDWVRNSGTTPSGGTGPEEAFEGDYYMYLEADDLGFNSLAVLESGCFTYPEGTLAAISFNYHMYGEFVGSLTIQMAREGESWSDIWSVSGDQGNFWNEETLNIATGAGGDFQFRIVGKTGPGWSGDVAVDNLYVSLVDVQAPTAPADLVAVEVMNTGLTLNWTASSDNVGIDEYDVFQGMDHIGAFSTTSVDVSGLIAGEDYTFYVVARDTAGNASDTSNVVEVMTPLNCFNTVSSYDYIESFESDEGWMQATWDEADWERINNGSFSNHEQYYMRLNATPNETAVLLSPCFDLPTATTGFLSFAYGTSSHNHEEVGSITLQVAREDASWVDLWSSEGSTFATWKNVTLSLEDFPDGIIQFRIVGKLGSEPSNRLYLDHVRLRIEDGEPPTAPTNLVATRVASDTVALSWTASTDNVGIEEYLIYNGADLVGESTTTTSKIGVLSRTAYAFYVVARDGRVNPTTGLLNTSEPSNVLSIVTPASCDNLLPVTFSSPTEGFETNDGWTQVPGDDGNWIRNEGGTFTNGTGPESAIEGTHYMYLRANTFYVGSVGTNAMGILESPCFDVAGKTSVTFSFQYHMYGASMGSLTVQLAKDDESWVDIWTLSGNQGDAWNKVSIPLDTYLGEKLQLRMVGQTGAGFQSDIAIDDMALLLSENEPPTAPANLNVTNVTSNSMMVSWEASVDNSGVIKAYNLYQGGVAVGTYMTTFADVVGLQSGTNYTYQVEAVDFSANISSLSEPIDQHTLVCDEVTTTLPLGENLESSAMTWEQSTEDNGDWLTFNGNGPVGDTYLSLLAGSSYLSAPGINAMGILESPCFDVPVSELVQFSFYFRLAGSAFGLETLGTLKVQAGTDDAPWTDLWVAPNNQGSGWRKVTLDLSDYAGQNGAKLRLIGTTGSRSSSDVDLDGLLIAVDGAVCSETSSLPYAEGFEDQLGWENIDWDLGDWTRTDEGTSSSQTGPASAAEGSYYLYLNSERYGETAVGSNARVTLESQCFDLSAVTTPVFSFQYHMYGEDMGSLTVQVATESTRWADAWTLFGNQGNAWQRAEIDLSAYLGEVVQLRIVGVTGDGDRSDMAIDELLLTVTDVEAPSQPTNLAALNITDTSLQLTWDASTDNAGVVGYDVYQGPDKIGTFATTSADISGLLPETTYTFTVVAKDANDNESPESTELTVTTLVATSITCTAGILLPYAEGFELGDGWTQVTGDDGNWRRNSGTTPSSGTGPEAAIEGTYYLHLEASDNSSEEAIGPDATAVLESECFDLSQETEAVFSFQYHMYGEDIGTLTLQATSDGTSWIDLWTLAGEQGNSWKKVNLNLDAFVGGGVRFRIVGTTGGDFQGDLAIDDLTITRGSVSNEPDLTLTITFDDYPEETEWEILEGGTVVVSSEDYASRPDRSTLVEVIALPEGCYDFVMKDEYGDGMCCSYGNGSYELTYGATTLAFGGDFAASETTGFCIGNRTASSRVAKGNKISDEVPNQTFDAFHIYPNPVVGNYLYTTQLKAQVSYQIINLMGQVISGGEVVENQIDVGQLKEGIYLIRFTSEGVSVDHLFAKGK